MAQNSQFSLLVDWKYLSKDGQNLMSLRMAHVGCESNLLYSGNPSPIVLISDRDYEHKQHHMQQRQIKTVVDNIWWKSLRNIGYVKEMFYVSTWLNTRKLFLTMFMV